MPLLCTCRGYLAVFRKATHQHCPSFRGLVPTSDHINSQLKPQKQFIAVNKRRTRVL